jgi:SAM-dependent methyltransferase
VSTFDEKQAAHWGATTNLRAYDHPVVRLFATQRVDFLRAVLAPWRPERALEVGCGDGFGMHHMLNAVGDVFGCDISPAMLAANPAPASHLTRASAYALPYADESFDLAYCWELLHHVDEPARAVAEMKRVARRCVLLCEPNALNPAMALFGVLKREERGLLRFTPGYTRRLLLAAGLRDVQTWSVGCFTPNRTPMWLADACRKLPYRWPGVGLYNIALGFVDGQPR